MIRIVTIRTLITAIASEAKKRPSVHLLYPELVSSIGRVAVGGSSERSLISIDLERKRMLIKRFEYIKMSTKVIVVASGMFYLTMG